MLVVDANASLGNVLAELFDDEDGFSVAGVAGSGEQALALAEQRELDVMLIDERLDDALPAAVLQGLRRRCPHAVLLVWCYDTVHTVSEHADGVVMRGLPFRDVVRDVRTALRSQQVCQA